MLEGEATNWPTPGARDPKGKEGFRGPHGKALAEIAETFSQQGANWRTPNTSDMRGAQSHRGTAGGERQLQGDAVRFPATPQTAPTGPLGCLLRELDLISYPPPAERRLNPDFSEWLMGWPPGLTACRLSETEWTRWWRDSLSSLWRLVSGSS